MPVLQDNREILFDYFGRVAKAAVKTYGCQQNVSDGERIKGMLVDLGCELTDCVEDSDIIILNTCAVREHAEDRVFGNVGAMKSLKQKNKKLIIGLCGCMTQQPHIAEKIKAHYPYVDIVFGANSLYDFREILLQKIMSGKRVFDVKENGSPIREDIPYVRDSTFKAWLPIMYGCDNFCSYCVVPLVRGRERSRSSDNIDKEFRGLVESGYKDITLLGQNVNSYGKGLEEDVNFAQLLARLVRADGDYRVRFMTSHPKDASRELIDTIAASEHICNHIHLPVQSGNDRILELMNRRYTAEKYMGIIDYARSKIPNVVFTSDIIVGFPGETEEQFEDTLRLVERVKFLSLFTFIYSPRENTVAAKLEDNISYKEKTERIARLIALQDGITAGYYEAMVGKTFKGLCEARNNDECSMRLENNLIVYVRADARLGEFYNIKVTEIERTQLKGELN